MLDLLCQDCGYNNRPNERLCGRCGAWLGKSTPPALPLLPGVARLTGLIVGSGLTVILFAAGSLFDRFGSRPHVEVAFSQGSAWFYLATLLVTSAALVGLFLRPIVRKVDGSLRTLLLVALLVMLLGMSFCNFLSASSLFPTSY